MDRLRFYVGMLSVRRGAVCSVANRLLKSHRNSQKMARSRRSSCLLHRVRDSSRRIDHIAGGDAEWSVASDREAVGCGTV